MEKIHRPKCVLSEKKEFESLHIFKDFPVFMGCTEKPFEDDITADMEWIHFPESGMIQLKEPLPLEVVYSEFHNSGCIGTLWDQHHNGFAEFISKSNPKNILEIGGGHGILSLLYSKLRNASWTIVEPNPEPAEGVTAKYFKGFFDENFSLPYEIDTIVHSHVFEHLYDPKSFIENISKFLSNGKKLIFSIPNMNEMLKRKYTNFLNFEHTYFLSEHYVEYFLASNGFKIIDKKYFKEDHSIFFEAVKDNSLTKNNINEVITKNNKPLFLKYITYHLDLVKKINNFIKVQQNPVYLFGAHVFAQYLISFGLDTSKIKYLLDNDPNKQNKRLYGTKLEVRSPKVLSKDTNPIVILKAGVYNEEIKKDILEDINSNTKFI